jgi:hypothetical protein
MCSATRLWVVSCLFCIDPVERSAMHWPRLYSHQAAALHPPVCFPSFLFTVFTQMLIVITVIMFKPCLVQARGHWRQRISLSLPAMKLVSMLLVYATQYVHLQNMLPVLMTVCITGWWMEELVTVLEMGHYCPWTGRFLFSLWYVLN